MDGLNWHTALTVPIGLRDDWELTERPNDLTYAAYAANHVRDLATKHNPDVLWNDNNRLDAGKGFGPDSIGTVVRTTMPSTPRS